MLSQTMIRVNLNERREDYATNALAKVTNKDVAGQYDKVMLKINLDKPNNVGYIVCI